MNSSASADPFFMEFGSSVSVNEDLYREIHNEVRQLDSVNQKTQHEIKGETRTQAHIAKDYAHATNEMKNLSRSTSEAVDEATMNEETRIQLVNQFQTGLLNYIQPMIHRNGDNEGKMLDDGHMENNNDVLENSNEGASIRNGGATNNSNQLSLGEVVTFTKTEMENALSVSQQIRKRIDEIATERTEIEKETSLVKQRLSSGSELNRHLEEAKVERDARRSECESEGQRIAALKEACHHARTKCTEYATALLDEDKKFDQKKKDFQEAEVALDTKIHETKAEIELIENGEIKEWTVKKDEIIEEVTNLEAQLKQIEDLKAKISTVKADREKIAKKMETAKAEEATSTEKQKQAEIELSKSEERLNAAKSVKVKAEALRGLNDKQEQNRPLQSLKDDIASYARDGERIAARTVEVHAQNDETERHCAQEKSDHEKYISDMEKELENIQDERDSIALKRKKIEEKQEEIRVTTVTEVKSFNATAEKLREAIKNQDKQNAEFARDIEQEEQAKVEGMKKRLALEKREAEFKLKVMKTGAKLLEETEEELQMLQERPLDDEELKVESDEANNYASNS